MTEDAKPRDPAAEARKFVRGAMRPRLRAFWLDFLVVAGTIFVGYKVGDALSLPRNAWVVVSDVRKGEALEPKHVVAAPLRLSARNVTKDQKPEQFVAARDIAAGSLLRQRDVAPRRPRAGTGEVELPLKAHAGRTPPTAGDQVLLGIVGVERGDPVVVEARVLSVDSTVDPALLTVAMPEGQATLLVAVRQPQIQVMYRPPEERKP